MNSMVRQSFFFGVLLGGPVLRSQLCGDETPYRPVPALVASVVDLFVRGYAPATPARRAKGGRR